LGWRVLIAWECGLRSHEQVTHMSHKTAIWLHTASRFRQLP
jgi:G:T-mismatch repair DNA endonuclease (very short patch repair protein)